MAWWGPHSTSEAKVSGAPVGQLGLMSEAGRMGVCDFLLTPLGHRSASGSEGVEPLHAIATQVIMTNTMA